jgi:1,4-dihydroxy-2-naphthoyl-CoA hydrolase
MATVPTETSDEIAIWERGFAQTIGGALPLHFEHVAKDRVVMTMDVDHRTHQPMGVLHGGASLVLAESAASTGANLACPAGMVAVGQEINANHLRPKTEGVLTATALPLHIGRSTQVWSVEIRDEAGKLVCISRCTLAVVPIPTGLATPRERGLMP